MALNHNITSKAEIINIVLAATVLTFAFAVILSGGIGAAGFTTKFFSIVPIAALAVALSFILHELMHKFVAQHYGATAEFRTSLPGLLITLFTSLIGFLVGIPGATYIFSNRFTKRENGIVSLAGPATNVAIFFVFLGIGLSLPTAATYYQSAVSIVAYISIFLAFFNMLPIYPLDGSKVLSWNPVLYVVVTVGIAALAVYFTQIPLIYIGYMIMIALIFSLVSRRVL